MLPTEQRNPNTTHIDKASTAEILQLIHAENRRSVDAVGEALKQIEPAVEAVAKAFRNGGRLIYVGAGTSGRLAAVDASECPPTFGVDYEQVSAVMAGGTNAFFRAAENQEDAGAAGVQALQDKALRPVDVVMGISASGNAAFILEALQYAKKHRLHCTFPEQQSGCQNRTGRRLPHLHGYRRRSDHRFHPHESRQRTENGAKYDHHRSYDPHRKSV